LPPPPASSGRASKSWILLTRFSWLGGAAVLFDIYVYFATRHSEGVWPFFPQKVEGDSLPYGLRSPLHFGPSSLLLSQLLRTTTLCWCCCSLRAVPLTELASKTPATKALRAVAQYWPPPHWIRQALRSQHLRKAGSSVVHAARVAGWSSFFSARLLPMQLLLWEP
jgi:hypothetical protein